MCPLEDLETLHNEELKSQIRNNSLSLVRHNIDVLLNQTQHDPLTARGTKMCQECGINIIDEEKLEKICIKALKFLESLGLDFDKGIDNKNSSIKEHIIPK